MWVPWLVFAVTLTVLCLLQKLLEGDEIGPFGMWIIAAAWCGFAAAVVAS